MSIHTDVDRIGRANDRKQRITELQDASATVLRQLFESNAHIDLNFKTWEEFCMSEFGAIPDNDFRLPLSHYTVSRSPGGDKK